MARTVVARLVVVALMFSLIAVTGGSAVAEETIAVKEHFLGTKFNAVGDHPSWGWPGDTYVAFSELRSGGAAVGTARWVCTLTQRQRDVCEGWFKIDGRGELVASGAFLVKEYYEDGAFTLSITGGSGGLSGSSGTVTSRTLSASSRALEFHLV